MVSAKADARLVVVLSGLAEWPILRGRIIAVDAREIQGTLTMISDVAMQPAAAYIGLPHRQSSVYGSMYVSIRIPG